MFTRWPGNVQESVTYGVFVRNPDGSEGYRRFDERRTPTDIAGMLGELPVIRTVPPELATEIENIRARVPSHQEVTYAQK